MILRYEITDRSLFRLLAGLVVIELLFAAIYLAEGWIGYPRNPVHRLAHELFNLNGEGNIVAWFSSLQLFVIAAACVAIAGSRDYAGAPPRWYLVAVAVLFVALSADEMGAIHERMSKALWSVEWAPRFRNNNGLWIPVYAVLGAGVVALLARPSIGLLRRYPRDAALCGAGLAMAVLGLAGLEIIGYQFLDEEAMPMLYRTEVAVEEMLEMAGMSLVLFGVLRFGRKKLAAGAAPAQEWKEMPRTTPNAAHWRNQDITLEGDGAAFSADPNARPALNADSTPNAAASIPVTRTTPSGRL